VAFGYYCLHVFFGFGIERVIGEVIGVEVGFDGLEIRHTSRDDSGSVASTTELKVCFDHTLQLLSQLNQVSGRRYDHWVRPLCFALSRNRIWSVCRLGTDCTENTASNTSSIV
jgi:hypothetical protein